MNQINRLKETLKPLLPWHGARLNFLALFLLALIKVKTVNLQELACGFCNQARTASSYKRLQRFFGEFDLNYSLIARLLVRLMNIPQPWILSLDRTEWMFGQSCINIFMLGIVHRGVAYPVVWTMLDKRGNSDSPERMDLLDKFQEIFPDAEIAYLCGDREFIGQEWLTYLLLEPMIPFRLRIKSNHLIDDGSRKLKASIIFAHLQPGRSETLSGKRRLWGRFVYLSALRLDDGELLIVISATTPEKAISDYSHRWGIETLFGILKTRGFCLESTHFQDPERLSKLLALISLALCWAIKTGEWLQSHRPLKVKKHGRKEKSIFRYGLDYLRSLILNLDLKFPEFLHSLQFLSCT